MHLFLILIRYSHKSSIETCKINGISTIEYFFSDSNKYDIKN